MGAVVMTTASGWPANTAKVQPAASCIHSTCRYLEYQRHSMPTKRDVNPKSNRKYESQVTYSQSNISSKTAIRISNTTVKSQDKQQHKLSSTNAHLLNGNGSVGAGGVGLSQRQRRKQNDAEQEKSGRNGLLQMLGAAHAVAPVGPVRGRAPPQVAPHAAQRPPLRLPKEKRNLLQTQRKGEHQCNDLGTCKSCSMLGSLPVRSS
jgi:hypothetical protein